jgi:hypothetical protein
MPSQAPKTTKPMPNTTTCTPRKKAPIYCYEGSKQHVSHARTTV